MAINFIFHIDDIFFHLYGFNFPRNIGLLSSSQLTNYNLFRGVAQPPDDFGWGFHGCCFCFLEMCLASNMHNCYGIWILDGEFDGIGIFDGWILMLFFSMVGWWVLDGIF